MPIELIIDGEIYVPEPKRARASDRKLCRALGARDPSQLTRLWLESHGYVKSRNRMVTDLRGEHGEFADGPAGVD